MNLFLGLFASEQTMGECGRFNCARFMWQAGCFVAVFLIALTWSPQVFSNEKDAKTAEKPPPAALPPIVCLHTEFLPYKDTETLRYRLMRELGRQALLIAARDELGISTRDDTLGEVFPESVTQSKQDVFVSVRNQYDGTVRYQLWLTDKQEKILPAKQEKPHDVNVILNLTEKLEPQIRGELRDKLRALGFEGQGVATNEKNQPSDVVEGRLLEMNFVSQFAAVRGAHDSIADKGASRGWLSVLARGYANLSLMTEHHWKSDTEAFAARGLLYAERLVAWNPDDALAHATRAYVRAIVGLHGAALDDLKLAEDLHKKHRDQKDLPPWLEVVAPYCLFEREPLHSISERRHSLRQLAQRLSFEQLRAFGDDRWMFEAAKQTMSDCPEEYSVYAILARGSGSLLAVVRTGANYAPAALAHFLPPRIASLEDAPPIDESDSDKSKSDKKEDESPAAEATGNYAATTSPIVKALRAATQSGADKGEPTWSALGELIFEEQFVQAAVYLKVAMNATESSHDEEVNSILPAVKGHRFERYIRTFGDNVWGDQAELEKIVGDMRIVDPRVNMQPMMDRLWSLKTPGNRWGRGANASWWAFLDRSMTYNGMLEAYGATSGWSRSDAETRKEIAEDFRMVSPHSPQALRMQIILAEKPTYEQLTHWEADAGEDPTAYLWIAVYFANDQHYDDAIRTYERSIKLSPTKDAYVGLANTYRAAGEEDKWQPTLERFFKVESLGLEHASVHQIIANDLMDKGRWEAAEPHATAAAETWSGWGLLLASRVNEGLGRWEESEKWAREASKAYPSYSGDEWYFWCRRTGRGNLEPARQLVQKYFSAEWIKTNVDGQLKEFTYHLSEKDVRAAFEDLKKVVNLAESNHEADDNLMYYQMHLAVVARELKETDAAAAAIKGVRELSEQYREKHPNFSDFNIAICDILDGKTLADDARAAIVEKMEKQPKEIRCNCYYFLGKAYDLAGNKDLAERYWKQCVTRGPFDRYNATLAGKYLSDRNKTSRP